MVHGAFCQVLFLIYRWFSSLSKSFIALIVIHLVVDGWSVIYVSDTSYGGLWEVSFTLKEF